MAKPTKSSASIQSFDFDVSNLVCEATGRQSHSRA